MQELLKILNTYNIKNKLFDVVTNNVSNNDTLKEKLEKCYASTFVRDIRENYVIEEICRRL